MEPSIFFRIFIFSFLFCGGVYSFSKRDTDIHDKKEDLDISTDETFKLLFNSKSEENEDESGSFQILNIIPVTNSDSFSKEVPYELLPSSSKENSISKEIENSPDENIIVELLKSEETSIEIKPEVIEELFETEEQTEESSGASGDLEPEGSAFLVETDDEDYVSDIHDHSGSGDNAIDDFSFEKSEENDEPLKVMCTQTNSQARPWWRVDLQRNYTVQKVVIFNRAQGFHHRLHDISVRVGTKDIESYNQFSSMFSENEECMLRKGVLPPGENVIECHQPIEGRYVSIQIVEGFLNILTLCEVEVYANDNGVVKNIALKKPSVQSGISYQGIPQRAVDGIVSAQFYAGEEHMSCMNEDEDYYDTSKLSPRPSDCAEIYLKGKRRSGVYTVYPKGWLNAQSFQVFCDMDKDGGGWTSILRRHYYLDHSESFHRFLTDYVEGFGELCEEFLLGLKHLHVLTTQNSVQLKVDIHNSYGEDRYALYEKFLVFDGEHNYKSFLFGYSGTAGDYLKSDVEFTMTDKEGGWWWHTYDKEPLSFVGSNPNGDLWHGRNVSDPITWGCQECKYRENDYIQFFDVKIRPTWFQHFTRFGRTIYG